MAKKASKRTAVNKDDEVPLAVRDFGNLSVLSSPEAAPVPARLHVWAPVPGLATGVLSLTGDCLEITVSAEIYQANGSVWFRALVDGRVARPSDVQIKTGNLNFDGVRSFTFIETGLTSGQHLVEIQMLSGSPVSVRDRVLTVHSSQPWQGSANLLTGAAVSGPPIQATSQWKDIPGCAGVFSTEDPSATLAIAFSAEAWVDSGRMLVRAVVDGAAIGDVIFVEAGDAKRGGTRSFTFVLPDLGPGGFDHHFAIQWRGTGGKPRMGDRTVSISAVHPGSQRVIGINPVNATTLTQTNWTDLTSNVEFETTHSISNIAVTASTEVLSNNGRVFLRVLLDGEPVAPTDVTLIQGGSKWRVAAHTFVVKNVIRGRHRVRVQIRVDPQTTAKYRKRSVRVLWKRRTGPDFVQPFLGMAPRYRRLRLLVIGFDPVRPGHPRPSFEQIRRIFEGISPTVVDDLMALQLPGDRPPNLRDWLQENSGGVVQLAEVRYVGCRDNDWYVAPPARQGNWYWDNLAWDQMWKDALAAADPHVDFHAYDTDLNNRLSDDELVVAIIRPQNVPYGTLRGTDAVLDEGTVPLNVPILDLYFSSNPAHQRWGLGAAAHELSHHVLGALDLYGVCPAVSSGVYSIMDDRYALATHLDPFEKMKNGLVMPWAIDLDTLATHERSLLAVELYHQIWLLHDSRRVAREYFLIENRFPGSSLRPTYDSPIGTGAVVIWQIFEDLQLVQTSAVCPGDVRFIRRRAVLYAPSDSYELVWSDGTPVGCRVTAPVPDAEVAVVRLEKV